MECKSMMKLTMKNENSMNTSKRVWYGNFGVSPLATNKNAMRPQKICSVPIIRSDSSTCREKFQIHIQTSNMVPATILVK